MDANEIKKQDSLESGALACYRCGEWPELFLDERDNEWVCSHGCGDNLCLFVRATAEQAVAQWNTFVTDRS